MTDNNDPTPEPTPDPTPAAPAEEARSESVAPSAHSDAPAAPHEPAPHADTPREPHHVESHPVPASPEVVPEAPEHAPAAASSPAEVAEVEPAVSDESPTAEPVPEPAAETADAPNEAEPATEPETEAEAPAKPKRTRKPKAATVAADSAETPAGDAGDAVPAAAAATEGTEPAAPAPESKKKWYAVKIQSGREESIKSAIERKVKIEGLEEFFGQIVIPVEEMVVKKKVKVKNKKTGETTTQEKNVTKYNKKYPGYLFTEVEFNDQILYVFRETSGVGDFVGIPAKKKQGAWENVTPSPMTDREVQSMLTGIPDPTRRKAGQPAKTVVKLDFEKGDKVRIRNGAFVGSEGEVKSITEPKDPTETPKVTVVVTFWGRPVDVEVDYWEVDKV